MRTEGPPPAAAVSEGAEASAPRDRTVTQTQESALPRQAPAGAPRPLPRGATLGRYVVLEYLGAGGMGVVYSAYDFGLDRKVSLKLVRGDRRDKGERQARLLREAQAMARLTHPNVVAVHDVGTFEDQVFIAMEFMGGGTLKQWLRRGPRPWGEVLDAFLQAGQGLAAAHRAGLVHRDFKPDNVLLGNDGRPRVTDFGLAVHASPSEEAEPRHELLPPGRPPSPSGTAGYMAPEQRQGFPPDPRADQYSFCVALHEGLFGERPARDDGGPARLAADPRVPRRLIQVLRRGLAEEPADRFPTLDALLEELEHGRHPARRSLAVAGALATAGVLGSLFLLASPARREEPPAAPRCEASPPAPALFDARALAPPAAMAGLCPVPSAPGATSPEGVLPAEATSLPPLRPLALAGEEERTREARVGSAAAPPADPPAMSRPPRFEPDVTSSSEALSRVDEARRLSEHVQQSPDVHPVSRLMASLVERLTRLLEGESLPGDPGYTLAFEQPTAASPGLSTWPLATANRVQPGALAPSAGALPGASDGAGSSGAPGPNAQTVAELERALAMNLAAHRSSLEIAQSRFALAQALWDTQQDRTRALALAQQADEDLANEGQDDRGLKSRVSIWLKDKLELRRSGQPGLHGP